MRSELSIFDLRMSSGVGPRELKFAARKSLGYAVATVMLWAGAPISQKANAQSGGGYLIKKGVVASGGHSNVTGGAYRLSGTVGQHDAAELSGGSYALTGGFWSPTPSATAPDPVTPDPTGISKTRFISFAVLAAAHRIDSTSDNWVVELEPTSLPDGRGTDSGSAGASPSHGRGTDDPPQSPLGKGGGHAAAVAGVPLPDSALRVNLVSLHHVVPPYSGGASVPFTSFEGQVRWVGPPTQYIESSANPTPFYAAALRCTPHYQDWSTVGLLHVTGSAIVPSSVYEVENVAASCVGIEASCTAVSEPLTVTTTRWGDVAEAFNPPSTTTQPDLADISTLVNKFRSTPSAPIKARALLAGDDAFGNFSVSTMTNDFGFGHIAACVDAFRGRPYPYTIQTCP